MAKNGNTFEMNIYSLLRKVVGLMRGFISAIYNSYRARKDMDGAPCFCRWKSCSKSCASFFLANPRRVVSFFSPVQSVYLIFTYHVPRFVSLWTDKRSSLSLGEINNIQKKPRGNHSRGFFIGIAVSIYTFLCVIPLQDILSSDGERGSLDVMHRSFQ